MEKTLKDAGIKLSSVASEVLGVSARRMLDALISGTNDPEILAELAKARSARRSRRCAKRSRAVTARNPGDWIDEQLADIRRKQSR